MPTVISPCRLCGKDAELRASHIIPDFFGRGGEDLYPTGRSGTLQPFTQPVHTSPGRRFKRMQRGFWERRNGQIEKLLCHECEQRLSGFEDYAKKYFYGGSSPIRLRQDLDFSKALVADYQKMKLFQLSLLWRANVASGAFFAKVAFPDSHTNSLSKRLLENNAGTPESYPCTVWRMTVSSPIAELVKSHGAALETMIFEPVSRSFGEGSTVLFALGGIAWLFWVANSPPPSIFGNTYIKENGMFFFDNFSADGFFHDFSAKAVQAGNVTLADVKANRAAKRGR